VRTTMKGSAVRGQSCQADGSSEERFVVSCSESFMSHP
jgi:hypothetical protein